MKLSKRCVYGLQAAVRLAARESQGYTQSRDIAKHEHLPAKFLESILLSLRSAELLESKVGAGGGYRLAKPGNRITVTDVLGALEQEDDEPTIEQGTMTEGQHALANVNERIEEALKDAIGSLTLSELAEQAAAELGKNTTPMYYI
ncbi:MAG: Rrf2 family transcriptional regulator [Planctomycetota bacterium]